MQNAPRSFSAPSPSPASLTRIRATSGSRIDPFASGSFTPSAAAISPAATKATPFRITPSLRPIPILAELGNLYVPGIESDGASTAKRILTGYALDPVNNIVNEFLPDMASHIHVRIIFFQQILNNIAVSGNGPM